MVTLAVFEELSTENSYCFEKIRLTFTVGFGVYFKELKETNNSFGVNK